MTSDEFRRMLDSLADGWARRDYVAVIEHFATDVFYCDPLRYTFQGKSELFAFFSDDCGMTQDCVFHRSIYDEERQAGVAEYTYTGNHIYHGTVWIEILDGKISCWREYQHISNTKHSEFWKGSGK